MTQLLGFLFPNGLLWLVLLAALVPRVIGRKRGRATVLELSILLMGLFSIPWVPAKIATLWTPTEISVEQDLGSDVAVLVLSGGRKLTADGLAWPTESSIRRGVVGVALAQERGLPLVISGGRVLRDEGPSEAALIAKATHAPEGTVLDERASNTWETAEFMADALQAQGWRGVILVSDPLHLRRARAALTAAGVPVLGTAAPNRLAAPGTGYRNFLPTFRSFGSWHGVAYELAGSAVYVMRGQTTVGDLFPES